jgi:hypothetical protein
MILWDPERLWATGTLIRLGKVDEALREGLFIRLFGDSCGSF